MAKATCSSCRGQFENDWLHWVCSDCNYQISPCCINKHEGDEESRKKFGLQTWENYLCGKCGKTLDKVNDN